MATANKKKPNMLVDEWLTADGLILLEAWARDGWTVADIATRIGVTTQQFNVWMGKYPEIKQAVRAGRELVDYKVENALLKAALGYKTREVRIRATIRNGKVIAEEKETIDKEFAPNVSACQTWLYNRKPDKWKSNTQRNGLLDNIDEDTSITITVERASANEAAEALPSNADEPDTDWQNDVNKSVTVRGLSEQEKAQKQPAEDPEEADTIVEHLDGAEDGDKTSKASKRATSKERSKGASNAKEAASKKAPKQAVEVDVDYWPDDWGEDDG